MERTERERAEIEGLAEELIEARARTLELVGGLDDVQLMGPRLPIVNPMRWELGHLGWFQERWALRHLRGEAPILPGGDALYDSTRVAHDTRWDLPLLSMSDTRRYLATVLERLLERLRVAPPGDANDRVAYFHRLVLFHEDMHGEALSYTRQTLAYPPPPRPIAPPVDAHGPLPGDVEVPGGRFLLGATADEPFVFDNEKWSHPVEIAAFRIARAPVTNGELAEFVEAGGYRTRAHWSDDGWRWRSAQNAERPIYWERASGGGFQLRHHDRLVPLPEQQPALHVAAHEADAYAAWAGRRLPSEAEWELAASGTLDDGRKPRAPWSNRPATAHHANLDGLRGGPVDVAACAAGDSPYGCRQMIGNVWEWTASRFLPYPGFVVDPYAEYSAPWFETPHRVLRGGCFATRARLVRLTYRNFYPPDRRDVYAGFRTCARR